MFKQIALIIAATGIASQTVALETSLGKLQVAPIVQDLDTPWGFAEQPSGDILVTLRDGTLILVTSDQRIEVQNVPVVATDGQGGLLDITLARDFARTRALFLTYAKEQPQGSGTTLARARLSDDGSTLENVVDLFESAPVGETGRHFGSRVVEALDGTLFVTLGDRGNRPSAQDRSNHNGSIVRINRDGSVPADNPFLGVTGVAPEIYSFGHRNPQGARLDAAGTLWTAEHGAKGGDEVNRIVKGANYGWPVISYGVHYSGGKIGEGTAKDGMLQPLHYWDPSIAPSGLLVYTGQMFPEWQGDILVGSLKFDLISRLTPTDGTVREVERLQSEQTNRVRDIQQAADGSIWFLSAGDGVLYRISRAP
ncbi:MAG: PQQ-dependent sugar dehydrogenase [Ascidiaceihabitans sp.]|nr:PQQ-dependent sugar dehydrogenase [Ascidiaceihabitans sp.]